VQNKINTNLASRYIPLENPSAASILNVGKRVNDRPANQHNNVECEKDGKRCEHILFGYLDSSMPEFGMEKLVDPLSFGKQCRERHCKANECEPWNAHANSNSFGLVNFFAFVMKRQWNQSKRST
jgi:hypothetical protein